MEIMPWAWAQRVMDTSIGVPLLQEPGIHHLPDPVRPELPDGAGLVGHRRST